MSKLDKLVISAVQIIINNNLVKKAGNISIGEFGNSFGKSVLDILFCLSTPSPKPGFKAFHTRWFNKYISGINTRSFLDFLDALYINIKHGNKPFLSQT